MQTVGDVHPGLLSGIVLTGANRSPLLGQSDGILTALEVEEMDLGGVEMAALSACETGLGVAANGDGLLGLQRAFQIAGAKTVVASLWNVGDESTHRLMVHFYQNLWERRMGKVQALREAQLQLMREGSTGGAATQPTRLPPKYWAAFVLSGDWR
jgi:CHAT domain-containing protein